MATRNDNHQSSLEASESLRPGNVCGQAASGIQRCGAIPFRLFLTSWSSQRLPVSLGSCSPPRTVIGGSDPATPSLCIRPFIQESARGAVSLCPLPFPTVDFELSVARNSHWPAIALPSSMLMMIQTRARRAPAPSGSIAIRNRSGDNTTTCRRFPV